MCYLFSSHCVPFQLQKDFEEDKQQAVSRAMSNVQREVDRARRQAEERCKEQYMEEMKKLAQKHKAEISSAKKKQWVSIWQFFAFVYGLGTMYSWLNTVEVSKMGKGEI